MCIVWSWWWVGHCLGQCVTVIPLYTLDIQPVDRSKELPGRCGDLVGLLIMRLSNSVRLNTNWIVSVTHSSLSFQISRPYNQWLLNLIRIHFAQLYYSSHVLDKGIAYLFCKYWPCSCGIAWADMRSILLPNA